MRWLFALAVQAACGRVAFDETTPAPPDGAPPSCTFCDGFDGSPVFGQWDSAVGVTAVSANEFVSPPQAMVVSADAAPNHERKLLEGAWRDLDCSFQLNTTGFQSNVEVVFIAVQFAETTRPNYGVSIHVAPTEMNFFEGYDVSGSPRLVTGMQIAAAPPPGPWTKVRIAMGLGLGTTAIASVGAFQTQKALDQAATVTAVELRIGTTNPASGAAFDVYVDDVACQLQ